jgi:hypothetical protein
MYGRLLMKLLDRFLTPSQTNAQRRWLACTIPPVLCVSLAALLIYGFQDYGIALFVFLPCLIAAFATVIYGYQRDVSFWQSYYVGLLAHLVAAVLLLVFAMEGMICILMAAPFIALLSILGTSIGYAILNKINDHAVLSILLLTFTVPLVAFIEKDSPPTLTSVSTSIEIAADAQKIWEHIIEFPALDKPDELLFNMGIAYPTGAVIEGRGVGAVRHCNFTTGSFVEPITTWQPPYLLQFDVLEQPAPMRELSFWQVDAPHLHDYFVSKRGQFKLTPLPNGNTLVEGTTWYYHDISPEFYWHIWSEYIIHKIHHRVLTHIKKVSEN